MTRRIVLGILIVLVLIAGAAGIGLTAYRFGVMQGLAQSDKVVLVQPPVGDGLAPGGLPQGGVPRGGMPFGYYGAGFYHQRFGFGPFGFIGCLFPLLFLFLVFALLRGLFWRGHWGWGHHGWGPRGHWEGRGVPPMFEEWHKQAHGQTPPPTSEAPNAPEAGK